ncbi:MAG: YbjN domain-containing protein, partial [Okeania sp. SIO2G5]|nr:YbjN domain-containing protein [Okeania sp. SIO2G5]
GDVGYTTLWSYLLIHPFTHDEAELSDGDDIVEAFANLFKTAAVAFQTEFEKQLPQLQSNWLGFLDDLKETVDEVVDDLKSDSDRDDQEAGLESPPNSPEPGIDNGSASVSLMDQVVKPFFDGEDWSFVQLDNTTLQLAFQGSNGRWTCLAESSDDTQQFIFYSLYPLQVESAHYSTMSEFLMRANSGMIIGNFELDFMMGELRFKTSVDVDGIHSNLSSCYSVYQQLWQQLAYINVITMDRYFPGITAIVNQTLPADEAIALVEQPIPPHE